MCNNMWWDSVQIRTFDSPSTESQNETKQIGKFSEKKFKKAHCKQAISPESNCFHWKLLMYDWVSEWVGFNVSHDRV